MATERLSSILNHLSPSKSGLSTMYAYASISNAMFMTDLPSHNSIQKNSDDIVITCAIRTPLTKAGKGGLKDTPLDFLVYQTLKNLVTKSKIDPQLIEDVCLGNVRSNLPHMP